MTPRSFFLVVLKLAGLWLLLSGIQVIIQFFGTIAGMFYDFNPGVLLGIILVGGLYWAIVYFLILRPEKLVDSLRLDQGFTEERFNFGIHRSDVLKIAVIVIGGLIFIDAIPNLCQRIFSLVREQRIMQSTPDVGRIGYAIFYAVQMVVGYFLMTGSRSVVNFIERNRRKK